MLISKGIISDHIADKERFPTYDNSDSLRCTPRELTLLLIRQHEFLMHRVVAVSEAIKKQTIIKYGEGTDMAKEVEAEEMVSRQDVSIQSLKRENSFMRKQLDCARLQAAEKSDEIENQASFIDLAKEAM